MNWWCLPRPTHRCWRGGDPAAPAEAPWILREHGSGTREIVDYVLLSHLPAFHLGMELGNSEAIKHAVRHGLGISCLSRRVIAEQLASGTLAELKVPLPRLTRTLWRIHHRQKHISKALQRFRTIARCSSPVLSPDYGGIRWQFRRLVLY